MKQSIVLQLAQKTLLITSPSSSGGSIISRVPRARYQASTFFFISQVFLELGWTFSRPLFWSEKACDENHHSVFALEEGWKNYIASKWAANGKSLRLLLPLLKLIETTSRQSVASLLPGSKGVVVALTHADANEDEHKLNRLILLLKLSRTSPQYCFTKLSIVYLKNKKVEMKKSVFHLSLRKKPSVIFVPPL